MATINELLKLVKEDTKYTDEEIIEYITCALEQLNKPRKYTPSLSEEFIRRWNS